MAEQAIPIRVIEDRMRALEAQIQGAQAELRVLMVLSRQAVEVKAARNARITTEIEGDGKLGASKAVVRLVGERPGIRPEEIADELHDKIDTTSKNPRRMILNTVANLVVRGRIKKDLVGGVVPAE